MTDDTTGVLDLTGADTKGFDAMDAGPREATVFQMDWKEVKAESTGKMPPGSKYLNVQFRISGPERENARVFAKYFPVPYAGQEPDKSAKAKGAFVNFLVALGYDEAEVTGGNFKLDMEDIVGKPLTVILNKKFNTYSQQNENNVVGVKPAGSSEGGSGSSASQLL